jgi:rhodanese-related sulfurtransferase
MPVSIDRDEVRRLLEEGAQLVEVLPAPEYEDEHLPGARNIRSRHSTRPPRARSSASGQ